LINSPKLTKTTHQLWQNSKDLVLIKATGSTCLPHCT